MSDIDRVVRTLVSSLEAPPDPATPIHLSPILCVLTVLLSLDKRKPGYVEERIKALQSPDAEYGTLAVVRDTAEMLTPEKYFRMDPRDDGKRAGLLLPLLDRLIDELRDCQGATEGERARAWATTARPSDWSFGPFRGLGLKGFQHLRQLLGANTVIPTKAHLAFVTKAVGRPVDGPEAVILLERAAGRLGYDLAPISVQEWERLLSEATIQKAG